MQKFTQEAKKYGVLYCVLADRKNKDPNAEVDVCLLYTSDAPVMDTEPEQENEQPEKRTQDRER